MTSATEKRWRPFRAGATVGEIGSEAGVILRDEEHVGGARITLERAETRRLFRRPVIRYAITCGIYGWMVHTRFFTTEEMAVQAYQAMKPELARISEGLPEVTPTDSDLDEKIASVASDLSDFTEQFP